MDDFTYIRILLIEDNTQTANVLQRLLEFDGSDVEVCYDVAGALRMAAKHSFDLVISDIALPDGDGRELMRLLNRKYGLIGIAISGFCTIDEEEMHAVGFSQFLPKPISFDQLKSAIITAFAKRREKAA